MTHRKFDIEAVTKRPCRSMRPRWLALVFPIYTRQDCERIGKTCRQLIDQEMAYLHHRAVVDAVHQHLVDPRLLELVLLLKISGDLRLGSRRRESAGQADNNNALVRCKPQAIPQQRSWGKKVRGGGPIKLHV